MTAIGQRPILHLALVVVLTALAMLGTVESSRADGPLVHHSAGTILFGYRANDIVLDGNFAYVATDKGLTILDISNPLSPQRRGSVVSANCQVSCTRGPIAKSQGLAKRGSYVYLAAGAAGMQVIDVTNPDAPVTIASAIAPTRGTIYHIAIHPGGGAAYVASYGGEVYVWNIANPAAPVLTQTLGVMMWGGGVCDTCVQRMFDHSTNGTAYVTGVTAVGNLVAAVDWGYGGLYLWDSTNPLQLSFRGTHRLKVSMYRVALDPGRDVAHTLGAFWINSGLITLPIQPTLDEGVAYCSTLDGGPVPAPASPAPPCGAGATCVPCGQAKMTTASGSALVGDGGGVGFSTNGRYAYYIGGRGTGELAIVDVTNPFDVVKVASTPVGQMGLQLAEAAGIVARDDVIYVAAGLQGVRVYQYAGLGSSAP
jgi:hypothetical protein